MAVLSHGPEMTARLLGRFRSMLAVPDGRLSVLFRPIDSSFLAYFRIAFGSIMVWETWRFINNDWIGRYFSGKEFYFKYWPFDFVQPWPGEGMYIHLVVMGIFACFVALGLFYRISAAAFFLMITYLFLLEKARYLNHLYLVCLLSFVMVFLPAHRYLSLDVLLRPALRAVTAPLWTLWLLRFQIGVPMLFGGLAKLNMDWLRGEPLRAWLAARTDFPVLGQLFLNEPVVWVMVYTALLADLFFIFYMLHRRTRVFGFILVLLFHFMNARLFDIGIFPWLMIAATLVFFGPDWPRRVWCDIKTRHSYRLPMLAVGAALGFVIGAWLPERFDLMHAIIGALGVGIAAYHLDEPFAKPGPASESPTSVLVEAQGIEHRHVRSRLTGFQKCAVGLLGLWVAVQVLVPLRHLVIPGDVHWTEEGHEFAWHMKLRDKDSEGFFVVTDRAVGEEWVVDPREHLTQRQTSKMASRPEMILQFAHYLERLAIADGHDDVEVRAHMVSSLNGRVAQRLIDSKVDLTLQSRPWLGHASWILPLETPLRPAE
ncbi:MAG: HTTM domain-containing protein [Chloroflexi bacterium]|nr:HTTM domain-containing protein [Chloroflexota bacterium]